MALLGLSMWREAVPAARLTHGLTWLTTRQHANGSWPFTDQLPDGSWTTALAILALDFFEPHQQSTRRGASWLLRQKGKRLGWIVSVLYRFAPHALSVHIHPDLQGWPWAADTFSWVEPTAYALIALQKLRSTLQGTAAADRIREGELVLYDRMCAGGGWNYGNTKVLGEHVPPYPETTALALIALQHHQTAEPNQRSVQAAPHDARARWVGAGAQLGDPLLDALWSRRRGVADTAYEGLRADRIFGRDQNAGASAPGLRRWQPRLEDIHTCLTADSFSWGDGGCAARVRRRVCPASALGEGRLPQASAVPRGHPWGTELRHAS